MTGNHDSRFVPERFEHDPESYLDQIRLSAKHVKRLIEEAKATALAEEIDEELFLYALGIACKRQQTER